MHIKSRVVIARASKIDFSFLEQLPAHNSRFFYVRDGVWEIVLNNIMKLHYYSNLGLRSKAVAVRYSDASEWMIFESSARSRPARARDTR